MSSAHETLDAIHTAQTLFEGAKTVWLLPPLDTLEAPGWHLTGLTTTPKAIPYVFPFSGSLFEGDGVLAIDYQYNHPDLTYLEKTVFIKGTFTYLDFCTIVTVLLKGKDEGFIPSQLMLEDLHPFWERKGVAAAKLYPWHTAVHLRMHKTINPMHPFKTLDDLKPALDTVMQKGYAVPLPPNTLLKATLRVSLKKLNRKEEDPTLFILSSQKIRPSCKKLQSTKNTRKQIDSLPFFLSPSSPLTTLPAKWLHCKSLCGTL